MSNDPNADLSHFIEKYKNFDNISFYINAENLGLAGNMNRGAMLAHGKFVAYLHDDDLLKPNYIQEISKILLDEKYNDALCFVAGRDYIEIGEPDIKQNTNTVKSIKNFVRNIVMKTVKSFISLALCWRWLYRKNIMELKPEFALILFGNIYLQPSCGTVFNRAKFFEAGGWTSEGEMSYDWYSFLKFNFKYKIYMIKKSLGIYRNGLNISSQRSTRINFCRNDFALLNRKYDNDKINKYFAKYGRIIKYNYMSTRLSAQDEREEVYSTLNVERDTPSKLTVILYKIKCHCFMKIHNLD